jgi:UDP-N-acetylmuramoyl-tripeptide--D-alanyl-D-alanine ligase
VNESRLRTLRLPATGPPRIAAPLPVRIGRRLYILLLVGLARLVLRRYRPKIVVVTGSVGKTTTKELVAAVVARGFSSWSTRGGSNNEVGVPATILGAASTRRGGWVRRRLSALVSGARLLAGRGAYPQALVLEMAAGRPGELERMTRAVRPDVAVVTCVREVHLEFFGSLESIAAEKAWVVRRLRPGGVTVVPADDEEASRLAKLAPGPVVLHSLDGAADLWLEDVRTGPEGCAGTLCIRQADGTARRYPFATKLLGRHQLRGVLAAVGVGLALGIAPEEALEAVAGIEAPPARLRKLAGRRGLTVLDDSHNASPQAVVDALQVLSEFPGPRWAVLGDMRELGPATDDAHRWVGRSIPGRADRLLTVGPAAALVAESAVEHGLAPARIWHCDDAEAARSKLAADTFDAATVLVKGSRAVGLELVVEWLVGDAETSSTETKDSRRRPS